MKNIVGHAVIFFAMSLLAAIIVAVAMTLGNGAKKVSLIESVKDEYEVVLKKGSLTYELRNLRTSQVFHYYHSSKSTREVRMVSVGSKIKVTCHLWEYSDGSHRQEIDRGEVRSEFRRLSGITDW